MNGHEITEQPWLQRPRENARWYQRFSAYLAMGAGRSVRGVYNAERGNERSKAVPASWTEAAHRHEWQRRAEAFDAWRRAAVFAAGNAADTERIKKLDTLIDGLCNLIAQALERVDPTDIDVYQLSKLIVQFLAALDLLAKHTGGYAPQRIEHTGKDGKVIQVESEEEQTLRVVFYVPEIDPIPGDGALDALEQPGEAEEKQ